MGTSSSSCRVTDKPIPKATTLMRLIRDLWFNNAFIWRLARIMLLLIAGLVTAIMAFEDKLIYFPSKYPDGLWDIDNIPSREGEITPRIEDCFLQASDGVRIHGWFCTPQRKTSAAIEPVPAQMVLLWFHGNAGNITYRYDMIRAMMSLPVRVFIIDYRGYGKSDGKPAERGLYLDARAAWDYLTETRGTPAESIIIFGKSLGGAPAIDLATQVQPAGLIIQSSFTCASDMASSILPFFPTVLLHTKMDSINKIANVHCPKLFIHSPADEVVPYRLGRRLYEAASEPKQFYEVKGAPHNSTYIVGGKPYLDALRGFVDSCRMH
jgi:pimeloyl-ACP methyl ester carboxylesterase